MWPWGNDFITLYLISYLYKNNKKRKEKKRKSHWPQEREKKTNTRKVLMMPEFYFQSLQQTYKTLCRGRNRQRYQVFSQSWSKQVAEPGFGPISPTSKIFLCVSFCFENKFWILETIRVLLLRNYNVSEKANVSLDYYPSPLPWSPWTKFLMSPYITTLYHFSVCPSTVFYAFIHNACNHRKHKILSIYVCVYFFRKNGIILQISLFSLHF